MVLSGSQVKEILNKINKAVTNPTTIHPLDEEKVRNLFKDILEQDVRYEIGDIETIVGHLNPEYREYSRKMIFHIAEIQLRRFKRSKARKLAS